MSYQSDILASGLRIVYRPLASPVAYIGIAIGVGTRHEKRGQQGLAHFTEHMLFKGTPLRRSTQIIQRMEQIGGELNAYTSKEETILYGIFPKEYHYRALQLMSDIVQHSHFDPVELCKEQTVVIDEINSYEDSPSDLIFDDFEDILFRTHPLGHNILGSARSVARFDRRMEQRFFAQHYRVDNMVLFAQGELDYDRLVRDASELFPASKTPRLGADASTPSLPATLARETVRRRGTHQRHVVVGGYAYSMYDERRLALSILVNLLGGPGMSSRLNMALRERTGLVYHVECSYTAYRDTGLVAIYFGCAPAHMEQAIGLVYQELAHLTAHPLSEEEITATKRQLKGQLIVSNDSHEHTFLALGKSYLHHGRVDTLEETCRKIDAIGPTDLYEVACEVFAPDKMYRLIYK